MKHRLPVSMRSFRVRIALWSTLLSGVVVVAFCAGMWVVLKQMNAHRIDEDILRTGHRQLSMRQGPERWANLDESLQFLKGDDKDEPFILLVKAQDGKVVHLSSNWPEQLSPDSFVVPVASDFDMSQIETPPRLDERRPSDINRSTDRGAIINDPELDAPELPVRRGPGPFRGEGPPMSGPGGPPPRQMPVKTVRMFTCTAGVNDWRVGVMQNPEVTLVLGRNLNQFNAEMRILSRLFLIALPTALLLIAAAGWWVAQRALRPIRTLTNATEGITVRGLDQRIPLRDDDAEFNRLIQVFNGMMDRLETSFQQAVRFSADAAHELKTPLTILQGELEQALQTATPGSAQQQTYGTLFDEVQRLKAIIQKLLLLSLADSGQLRLNLVPNDLTAIVEDAVADSEILGPLLTIEQDLAREVHVDADEDLLRQVIQNLVSNAVKYNMPNGAIRFRLRREGPMTRLTVANTGPGISAEDRGKVFDRFYRGDKTRNRKVDGLGLGLSLAREIARAHHGDLALEDSLPGWTVFTLTLPVSSTA